ncbi:MAG: EamA family transporter [Phyllobacteriaceae bacterium]|nr:EamA family transporter [Phyllobacteriaceae bacterium]
MTPLSAAIVIGALACTVAGQLLFRGAALSANAAGGFANPRSLLLFGTAIALYGIMTMLWAHALRELPLSRAYPFMALSFLIIPIAEHFIYGQPWSWNAVVGGVVIIGGIVVTQL